MKTLFEKAVIRIGIDTIKIKLTRSIYGNDPMDKLINDLEKSFDKNEISVYYTKDYDCYFVKDIDSDCHLSKIYKRGKDTCMVEIFGMCQTVTKFEFIDCHRIILSVIGNLKSTLNTLEKIDVSLDLFYPHERTFVFDNSKRADFVDILNYQMTSDLQVHLTDISMHTIRVPKNQNKIIKFALNHKDIKSKEDKKHKDCYYRWVKQTSSFLDKVNYGLCEKSESTHFEIKINKLKILCKILSFFDKSERKKFYSSDYDHETDIHITRGSQKVSNIKYDKSKRDEEKHGCVQDVYNAIIEDMADTDDEYDDLLEYLKHTRVELRFFRPAVSSRQNPLDLNLESSYDELLKCIKDEIEKMTIFILTPDISTDDYVNLYKKRLKKVSVTKRLTPDDYGRILEITDEEWNNFENKINDLKSQFIKPNKNRAIGQKLKVKKTI